ncbi:hypothetical protein VFPPC_14989 [Pochonia chlamydosporia 170]|uniref:DUF7703 domain-containing protein n=1 Tax=Pochonia chlamydosporia 170 TaxID=1380566 RepID=A0A179EWT2_METCM|nr:hypothetical protein VFPPC_14989 [Pochonia chlamydosporia 170]OAQ57480.1 hypothetical protein VFPPC_14989 [Pochonia chlamydosporia 170]
MGYLTDMRLRGVDGLGLLPTILLSISLYAVIELNCIILATFKTQKSLYFWSFVVATNGIAPYSIGTLLMNVLRSDNPALYVTLIAIGWVAMVTGQSLVLYSRLHLVVRSQLCLRIVLTMIIIDIFILHVPNIVLLYGSNIISSPGLIFAHGIYEKIQVTGFALQELIISGLYIKNSLAIFSVQDCLNDKATRKMRNHLIWVNVIIILLDIAIIFLEAVYLYDIETALRPFVYSVKLKMEFGILNRLVELARGGHLKRSNFELVHSGANAEIRLNSSNGQTSNQGSLHCNGNFGGR